MSANRKKKIKFKNRKKSSDGYEIDSYEFLANICNHDYLDYHLEFAKTTEGITALLIFVCMCMSVFACVGSFLCGVFNCDLQNNS